MSAIDDHRPAPRRRRLPSVRRAEVLYPVCLVVAALAGWHLWVSQGDVPEYLWPSLPDVVRTLADSGTLRSAAADTSTLVVVGFLLAVAMGLAFAVLTVSLRWFEVAIFPLIVSTQFVPLIALAPLFIVWWGFGITPKVVIVTLFGYFAVLITTLTGLRSIEDEKIYLVRTMGANRLEEIWKIRLPQALPNVFAGLKITVTSCVIGAVVAEFTLGSSGLGFVILRAQGIGDSVTLVAGIIYLAVIGALAFATVGLAERLLLPWHAAQRGRTMSAAAS